MMFRFTRRAFTLIELLAVIIILAVVALIATPLILDVIDDAEDSATLSEVHLILGGAENLYASSLLTTDEILKDKIDGATNVYEDITTSGEKPETGSIFVDSKGKIALAIYENENCYTKGFLDSTVTVIDFEGKDKKLCTLDSNGNPPREDGKRDFDIVFTGTEGYTDWTKDDVDVTITVTDTLGYEVTEVLYCTTTSLSCVPDKTMANSSSVVLNENGETSKVCAATPDSIVECSDEVKVDKLGPTIDGLEQLLVQVDTVVDQTKLLEGVTAIDLHASKDEEVTITTNPTTISTSTSGVYTVEYIATDRIGNETRINRTVVVGSAPTVTFSPTSNSTWYSTNVAVTVNVTTTEGVTAENFKWCSTSEANCTPTTDFPEQLVATLTENGATNRICVSMDSNIGDLEPYCSGIYKIDKSSPTISAKSASITIDKGDSYNPSIYFDVSYGISGGSVSCSPSNTSLLQTGNQTVTCTATGGNGRSVSASKVISVINKFGNDVISTSITNALNKYGRYNEEMRTIAVKNDGTLWYSVDNESWDSAGISSVINASVSITNALNEYDRYNQEIRSVAVKEDGTLWYSTDNEK